MEPPAGFDAESFRIANIRRPRHFDANLQTLGPTNDQPIDRKAVEDAFKTQLPRFSVGKYEDEKVRIYTLPFVEDGKVQNVIQVARETEDLDRLWRSQVTTLLIFLPLALLAAGMGAMFLTNRAMRPIGAMRDATTSISETNLSERIPVQGQDEFAELGESFNGMVGRLESAFADLTEAYEQQRRFTADASHELRTPLTRIKLSTSAALEPGASEEERLNALRIADESAESMKKLVSQLLILAKGDAGQLGMQREKTDLRIVASEALDQVEKPEGIDMAVSFPEKAVYAEIDAEAIRRVFINLLENAYRHTQVGRVALTIQDDIPPQFSVSDEGEGIASEHVGHLTERFYRADSSRHSGTGGSGLGLAICKTIIDAHHGTISIQSEPGIGTTVHVRLG